MNIPQKNLFAYKDRAICRILILKILKKIWKRKKLQFLKITEKKKTTFKFLVALHSTMPMISKPLYF